MDYSEISDKTQIGYIGCDYFMGQDINELDSKRTMDLIRGKVADILELWKVHPTGKRILVTDEVIQGVLVPLYKDEFGPIYGLIDRCINIICTSIRDEFAQNSQNFALNNWVVQYGSGDQANPWGLRAHSKIKLRERRPVPMQFNMRY